MPTLPFDFSDDDTECSDGIIEVDDASCIASVNNTSNNTSIHSDNHTNRINRRNDVNGANNNNINDINSASTSNNDNLNDATVDNNTSTRNKNVNNNEYNEVLESVSDDPVISDDDANISVNIPLLSEWKEKDMFHPICVTIGKWKCERWCTTTHSTTVLLCAQASAYSLQTFLLI